MWESRKSQLTICGLGISEGAVLAKISLAPVKELLVLIKWKYEAI
jgi:hypothetical protein